MCRGFHRVGYIRVHGGSRGVIRRLNGSGGYIFISAAGIDSAASSVASTAAGVDSSAVDVGAETTSSGMCTITITTVIILKTLLYIF